MLSTSDSASSSYAQASCASCVAAGLPGDEQIKMNFWKAEQKETRLQPGSVTAAFWNGQILGVEGSATAPGHRAW